MKYRVVYTVVQPLALRTGKAAKDFMDHISDDLDEFCGDAICTSNVQARLQVWVPMPSPSLPNNGEWQDVNPE